MTDAEKISREVDSSKMRGVVEWLTKNTTYRIAGSEDERVASEYVSEKMRSCGLDVVNEVFYTYNSVPIESKVEVVSPERITMTSLPCAHIRQTNPDGEELELVYVGNGAFESYENIDVRGKLVLVEVSYSPPVPEKARIAYLVGAAGIICMNWGNDEEVICNRALKSVWGNPTPETFKQIPDIIGVSVTRKSGLKLKELCEKNSKVMVRVTALADRSWSRVHQPFGVLRGNGKSDEFILVGSHIDAWKPGVTCNATGNATALELCRILSLHAESLKRDIWFVFWNGHEIAEAAGSTWFVDKYWSELNAKCVGYVNIDSTGVRETEIYEIKASDELFDFSKKNASDMLDTDIRMMSLKKIGDQSLMGLGVPAIAQRMSFTQEVMDKNHGATLGWWNHTNEDSLDKCDIDTLVLDTQITLRLLFDLAASDILPYRYDRIFEKLLGALTEELDRLGRHIDTSGVCWKISRACKKSEELLTSSDRIRGDEYRVRLFNNYMMKLSRLLTNVLQTYAGKYGQDSYGYTKLSAPIPLLADVEKLDELDRSSMEYGMIMTEMTKNRNRISDAIDEMELLSDLYASVLQEAVD